MQRGRGEGVVVPPGGTTTPHGDQMVCGSLGAGSGDVATLLPDVVTSETTTIKMMLITRATTPALMCSSEAASTPSTSDADDVLMVSHATVAAPSPSRRWLRSR